ncbi:MAG: tRNA (adenine-N1)-methyltransferase [Candidatus Altiarchaeota archaeon]
MLLLLDEKGRTYLLQEGKDLHTNYGLITSKQLSRGKPGSVVRSNTGHAFRILEPDVTDFLRKAKRGPQAVTLKDCSLIAGFTGIRSGSRVVEAGVGSGVLSIFLANIIAPAKLVSYEIREDFASIAKENFKRFGVKNVTVRLGDISAGIKEKKLDLVVLDLPEPWNVTEHAKKALKTGGYVVSYSPSIQQSKKFHDSLGEDFRSETFEAMKREWNMDTVRPHTRMLGHTGFLTVARLLA